MKRFISVFLLMSGLVIAGVARADVLLDNTGSGTAALAATGSFFSYSPSYQWGWVFTTGSQQATISSVTIGYYTPSAGSDTITVNLFLVPQGSNAPVAGQNPVYTGTVTVNDIVGSQYFQFAPSSSWLLSANSNYLLTYTTSTSSSASAKTNPQNTTFTGSAGYSVTGMAQGNVSNGWSVIAANSGTITALYLQGAVYTPSSVPTLSEWSQMLLGLFVMTLLGWHFNRRQSF